ncbi:hypothetical protein ACWCXC_10205 [Streptomyces sp. NPDC001515]
MADHPFLDTIWQHLRPVLGPAPAPRAAVLLDVPDGTDFDDLLDAVSGRAGTPRTLRTGGRSAVAATARTGRPLVDALGDDVRELRAWAHWNDWIGCAVLDGGAGRERQVAVVAHREDPAAGGLPQDADWVERLRLLTGWEPVPRTPVDWRRAEEELGTRLPADYKALVDLFGCGSFDLYVDLLMPGRRGLDLVRWAGTDAAGSGAGRGVPVFPAPGGLLRWGSSDQELEFMWRTGAADPDDWTVAVRTDLGGWEEDASDGDAWERYDCGVAEFLVRMLTDTGVGYPTAGIAAHCFLDYE